MVIIPADRIMNEDSGECSRNSSYGSEKEYLVNRPYNGVGQPPKVVELRYCKCPCGRPIPKVKSYRPSRYRRQDYIFGHYLNVDNPNKGQFRGPNHHSWKGGRKKSGRSIFIYRPNHHFARNDGYVQEHRLVYEEYHKCCILPWILCCHRNGDGHDNRIENLELMTVRAHRSRKMKMGGACKAASVMWSNPDSRKKRLQSIRVTLSRPGGKLLRIQSGIKARMSQLKPSGPEMKVMAALLSNGITHFIHQYVYQLGIADFFIFPNIIVECDGEYWHKIHKHGLKDQTKNNWFKSHGYRLFRFSDLEIKNDANKCIKQIIRAELEA